MLRHQTSPAAGEHKCSHMGVDGGCTWQANIGQTGSRCDGELSARSCRSGGSLASARLAPRHGMAHTNFNSSDHGATTAGRHVPCKDFTISTTTGPTDCQRLPTVSSHRGKPNAAAQWPSDASMQRQQPRPATRGDPATRPRRAKGAGCTTPYVGWQWAWRWRSNAPAPAGTRATIADANDAPGGADAPGSSRRIKDMA